MLEFSHSKVKTYVKFSYLHMVNVEANDDYRGREEGGKEDFNGIVTTVGSYAAC